jgi:hypothetical protein
MNTTAVKGSPDGTSPLRRHALWLILIGLIVAAVVIAAVIVFSSDSSGVADRQQQATLQRVCGEWSGISAPELGTSSASAACSAMADWMDQQLRNGRMTGPTMWGSATALGSTCREWMDTGSRASISTSTSPRWCSEMVSWMKQHIGNWNDWMMHGNMMDADSGVYGSAT